MYLIIDETTKEAAIVDPVEPSKVFKAVEEEQVTLTSIFTTHHHWDHAGGNKEMLLKAGNLKVFGNDERIFGLTHQVKHNEEFRLGSLTVKFLLTPCHTTGHVCFYINDKTHPSVFTGDTLFLAGCGKFFEGDGADMYHALVEVLGELPGGTHVYCGHEYSVPTLEYAQHAQPDNKDVADKLKWARNQREQGLTCMPSLISEEKLYNPFLRVNEESMQKRCGTTGGIATMTFLRTEKDNFKRRTCPLNAAIK